MDASPVFVYALQETTPPANRLSAGFAYQTPVSTGGLGCCVTGGGGCTLADADSALGTPINVSIITILLVYCVFCILRA
jgi:hypothetical protein